MQSVLVIGYGNPGRLDDGLGPAMAAILEKQRLTGVTVDSAYQLSVEDAAAIAEHEVVVFVDASLRVTEPFGFERVTPVASIAFSSHTLEPPALLALAHDLFGSQAPGFTMAIRGYEFNGLGEELSTGAELNLALAAQFLVPVIRERAFDHVRPRIWSRSVEASFGEEIE